MKKLRLLSENKNHFCYWLMIISLFCVAFLALFLLSAVSVKAEDQLYQYVIPQSIPNPEYAQDVEIVFFQSSNIYEDDTVGIFYDIKGNKYKGRIFVVDEDYTPAEIEKRTTCTVASIRVAEGSTIHLSSSEFCQELVHLTDFYGNGFVFDSEYALSNFFLKCRKLRTVDFSGLKAPNNTSMSYMFWDCKAIKEIDLSPLDTEKVIYMDRMFCNCIALKTIDLSCLNTESVTTMEGLFYSCESLEEVNLSGLNTSSLTDMEAMFDGCVSLKSLDMSSFNTEKVTTMGYIFYACADMVSLDISSFDTSALDAYNCMSNMFSYTKSLREIRLGEKFTRWDTASEFPDAGNWTNGIIKRSSSDFCSEYPSHAADWAGTWYVIDSDDYLNAVLQSSGELVLFASVLQDYDNFSSGTIYDINGIPYTGILQKANADFRASAFPDAAKKITSVVSGKNQTVNCPESIKEWFSGLKALKSFHGDSLNTSAVSDMSSLFKGCESLSELSLPFDTAAVINMDYMFAGCSKLKKLDISSFNTKNVTSMTDMFGTEDNNSETDCHNLTEVVLGKDFTVWLKDGCFPDNGFWTNDLVQLSVQDLSEQYPKNTKKWNGTWSTKGFQYAVLDKEGALVFFVGHCQYPKYSTGTFEDFLGNEYSGTIAVVWDDFRGEKLQEASGIQIQSVRVADNQVIDNMKKMNSWFSGLDSLKKFSGQGFDTSNVTEMEFLFSQSHLLSDLDISSFNTSSVTVMGSMFGDCYALPELHLDNFDTSNVTDMGHMFYGCKSLKSLDLSMFSTENVIYMYQMFTECDKLEALDISSFNTSKITNDPYGSSYMYKMFGTSKDGEITCPKLRSVTLGKGFTIWAKDAMLPANGIWTNGTFNWSSSELCSFYPRYMNTYNLDGEWHLVPVNPFEDVKEGKFYYEPVLWAYYHNPQITTGTDDTHFSPNVTCTRGQVVTFLWRANGCPEPQTTENPFVDVSPKAFYYKAVLWALENKITTGTDTTHFSPKEDCTRAHVVTFMYRATGSPEVSAAACPFTDVNPKGFYYKAMMWAVENEITTGTSPTMFSPSDSCTRGQVVTFLYRNR